jgi:hypothetical protein
MKPTVCAGVVLAFGVCIGSAAFANPSMLPKHEGYPMGKATDPVTGQSLSNDPGQRNAGGEQALQQSARADDAHTRQQLHNENDERIVDKPGAGILPKVEGPQIKIDPPVKEGTRMPANTQ